MADELIRYNRIRSFIFNPRTYLSFGQLNYNLREDEIIVIQSVLESADYFEKLIPLVDNKYAKYNTFDTAEPIISQVYENVQVIDPSAPLDTKPDNQSNPIQCAQLLPPPSLISSTYWKSCFPKKFYEKRYDNTNDCGFEMIIDILSSSGKKYETNDIKIALIMEYKKYIGLGYEEQILEVLKIEGGGIKRGMIREKEQGNLPLSHIIMETAYILTNLDIWALMTHYNIPSIIISTFPLLETNSTQNILVTYRGNTEVDEKFIFILSPSQTGKSLVNKYSLIHAPITYAPDITINIPVSLLSDQDKIQEAITSQVSIEDFLRGFIKVAPIRSSSIKKVGKMNILDEPDERVKQTRKNAPVQPTGFVDKTKTKRFKRQQKKLKIIGENTAALAIDV
jgi:hypothetical protein